RAFRERRRTVRGGDPRSRAQAKGRDGGTHDGVRPIRFQRERSHRQGAKSVHAV
ncbi:unnamed protein product, partial [Amoebophrya sp. A25]